MQGLAGEQATLDLQVQVELRDVTFRVTGPDGKPVATTDLSLWCHFAKRESLHVKGRTDAAGVCRLQLPAGQYKRIVISGSLGAEHGYAWVRDAVVVDGATFDVQLERRK